MAKKVKSLKTRYTSKKIAFDKKVARIIGGLHAIAALWLLYSVYRLQLLPAKFLLPILGVLLVTSSLIFLWVYRSKGYISKIVTLIVTLAMLLLVPRISTLTNIIGKVTGADSETHTVNVLVLKDAPYQTIKDVLDLEFGANILFDRKNIDFATETIKANQNADIKLRQYIDYSKLFNDLYNGNVKVILLNEAHYAFADEIYAENDNRNLEEDTRILASYSYSEKVEDTKRDLDVTQDTFSIFVSGIDTYGQVSSVSRSDVNMIVTVSPKTNQILLTSIPRDYHVVLHTSGKKDKLTHAGIYGVNESRKTLEDLLDIDIDFYLRVNFSSVTKIVDALGGVDVNSQWAFTGPGGVKFNKGMNHVNGTQALSFVRERKSLPGGDNARVVNQQALITGIINKAMSPAIITNSTSFLNSVAGSFEFSMPEGSFNKLIRHQLSTMRSWDIIDIQLKGTGAKSTTTYSMPGWNLYVMEPDMSTVTKASNLIKMLENGEAISKDMAN